jgi:ArsR family transcriptional regulator, arsenate/arsenite/antimonite-responsive transcriptional repressor
MDIIEILKALGDPVRLKIVEMLAERGELCVCHIVEALDMAQPVVSHHLAKLRYTGLLNARKRGQWVDYSLNMDVLDGVVLELLEDLVRKAKADKSVAVCCPKVSVEEAPV